MEGKTVVLGVTGSIAAYKMANVASMLVKRGCDVHVVMTQNATNFINPITFETLTNNKCLVDTFDRNFQFHVAHVSLSQKADVFMVAPASADIIGKMANGIADDMLSTMVMAATCKVIVAPAMNTHMYRNRILQDNIIKLKNYNFEIVEPAVGRLACAAVGEGKLPDEETLFAYIEREICCDKDLLGKKVVVTAGPTREAIDPVRFISNRSTGKMGYSIAKAAMLRGADVKLISGPVNLEAPKFVEVINVESANEMYNAVINELKDCDILIKSAAVADYTPEKYVDEKIKKKDGDMSISLSRTKDILKKAGEIKNDNQVICGFSMETQNMLENSINKLQKKNCDMIMANNLKVEGAGFGTDTNVITIITKDEVIDLDIMSKFDSGQHILTKALDIWNKKNNCN